MANFQDTYKADVFLNTEQARKQLDKLQTQFSSLEKKRQKALDIGDTKSVRKFERDMDSVTRKMDALRTQSQKINQTLKNISGANLGELKTAAKALNAELSRTPRGTAHYRELTGQLRSVKTEMHALRQETAVSQSQWQRFSGFFRSGIGAAFGGIATITGMAAVTRKASESYAQMEEELANVRKYTGLAADAVDELNEEFKKIDTRTSREQLNALAGAAGRLGISSRDGILEFVDAADKINVALGDDLGDDAVDQIGKLASAFGEDKTLGLRGAMLATGSAVNELAQNSSSNAGYLVDFTARLSGIGIQAGISQSQIMGLASVLDENMQRDETSATALSQLITKMTQDPVKFAKIAGKNIKEFSDLVRNDANRALMEFFQALKDKGGFADLAPMFEGMGLNGTRAIGVLTVLADKIDRVRHNQQLAAEAYAKGTSVISEFNVMNNTAAAQREKNLKELKEVYIALGERLLPVLNAVTKGGIYLGKSFLVLIEFAGRYRVQIAALAGTLLVLAGVYKAQAVLSAYYVVKKKTELAIEIAVNTVRKASIFLLQTMRIAYYVLTGQIVKVTAAMRILNAVSRGNPWAAMLSVVFSLSAAVYGLTKVFSGNGKEMDENARKLRKMREELKLKNEISKRAAQIAVQEKTKIEELNKVIHSNSYTVAQRRAAIASLRSIIPEYHAEISNEGKLYRDNTDAIQKYIENLDAAALAEAIYAKKVKFNDERTELQMKKRAIRNQQRGQERELKNHPERYASQPKVTQTSYSRATGYVTEWTVEGNKNLLRIQGEQAASRKALDETDRKLKALSDKERLLDQMIAENKKTKQAYQKQLSTGSSAKVPAAPSSASRSGKGSEDPLKKSEEAVRTANERELFLNRQKYVQGLTDYRTYLRQEEELQLSGIRNRKAVYEKANATDRSEYLQLQQDELSMLEKHQKELTKKRAEEIERDKQLMDAQLKAMYTDPSSELFNDQKALEEALYMNEIAYLSDLQALYAEGTEERLRADRTIEEREQAHRQQREEEYLKQLDALKKEYLKKSSDELMAEEIEGIGTLHAQGLLSEEEYQRALAGIRMKYADMKSGGNTAEDADKYIHGADKEGRMDNEWVGGISGIMTAYGNYKTQIERIEKLRRADVLSEQEAAERKKKVNEDLYASILAAANQTYRTISSFLSAASSYSQACADAEAAKIERSYERQIAAAGTSSRRRRQLEEKRDKEIAAARSKANKRSMKMEIAQAFASTAMAAINAYATAPAPTMIFGPIAAAMAVAAGMLQIATIKKQHQAQQEGYYEGGFTGGKNYRRTAGVVHEGEFVANHKAVNNTAILPALRLIDKAQRENTVGSLTAADVSRSLGQGETAVYSPVINVSADNEQLQSALTAVNEAISDLNMHLRQGIRADVSIDGRNGVKHQLDLFEKLRRNR